MQLTVFHAPQASHETSPRPNLAFHGFPPRADDMMGDVVAGLSRPQKSLPSKYFYDQAGSELFERICKTPEYYPTRCELSILSKHAGEMAELTGERCVIVEPGCGNAAKARHLLDAAYDPAGYMAIDIARDFMFDAARRLAEDYPTIDIAAVWADYTQLARLPPFAHGASGDSEQKILFFPGSTLGNLTLDESKEFLRRTRRLLCGPTGKARRAGALIGLDRRKDPAILNAAYNDAGGVTAAFNLNILHHVNRALGADFDPSRFEHFAFYDEAEHRVEMHLRSLRRQSVRIGDHVFAFQKGETIHTENSHKYGLEDVRVLARQSGFVHVHAWSDPDDLFSLHFLRT